MIKIYEDKVYKEDRMKRARKNIEMLLSISHDPGVEICQIAIYDTPLSQEQIRTVIEREINLR